jgi:hypothetical protein
MLMDNLERKSLKFYGNTFSIQSNRNRACDSQKDQPLKSLTNDLSHIFEMKIKNAYLAKYLA